MRSYQKLCEKKRNKKILLHERKRHTARCVASTPFVVLTGYPPSRVPRARVPPWPGYPLPPSWTRQGNPPPPAGPGRVPPWLPRGILGNVAKHYGIWVPPLWTDRLMDGRTDTCQNITFPSYYVRGR